MLMLSALPFVTLHVKQRTNERRRPILRKSYKYRLSPTRKQAQALQWTLDRCRELYNAALQERRDAYRMCHLSVNYYDQAAQLSEIKECREEYKDIHSQVLQDVLKRVEKGMQAFYRRIKAFRSEHLTEGRGDSLVGARKKEAGYPRFQGRERYDSFTYPQGGYSITHDNRVSLSKIGSVKVKLHRPIEGNIKTATVKREGDHWYVVFSCEMEQVATHLPSTDEAIGIDLGLLHFATLSTGDTIENPRFFRKAQADLARKQQYLSRCKKGSHRRNKAKKQVAKAHRKGRNQRADFLHKESRKLVNTYAVIVFEALAPSNMSRAPKPKQDENGVYLPNGAAAKGGLNKSILDAGWSQFVSLCTYKAANAGMVHVIKVDPKYTSQVCSGCGQVRKKDLSDRWHSCECGTELDRDHNAARNILSKGMQQLTGGIHPTFARV